MYSLKDIYIGLSFSSQYSLYCFIQTSYSKYACDLAAEVSTESCVEMQNVTFTKFPVDKRLYWRLKNVGLEAILSHSHRFKGKLEFMLQSFASNYEWLELKISHLFMYYISLCVCTCIYNEHVCGHTCSFMPLHVEARGQISMLCLQTLFTSWWYWVSHWPEVYQVA